MPDGAVLWVPVVTALLGLVAGRLAVARVVVHYVGHERRHWLTIGLTVALFAAVGWRFAADREPAALPAFLFAAAVAVALGVIDGELRRLPDPLTLPSYPAGLVLLGAAVPIVDEGPTRLGYALIGLAALWLVYAVQYVIAPTAIGRGDVKLAGVLGLHLGWLGTTTWVYGLIAGYVLGGLYAVVLLATRRAGRKDHIPFGPFMLAGAFLAILV